MTKQDIYVRLREHLDSLPVGFPSTKSGVELRILRRLFTEEEAEMACHLQPLPETVEQIAKRTNRDSKELEALLEQMAKKGLIFKSKAGGKTAYRASWFVIGIYEAQVKRLTKEFAQEFEEYIDENFEKWLYDSKTPQLRVVPVQSSITPSIGIASYEDARELIRQQSKIAVTECICKKEKALLGEGCDKPREVCLAFSTGAWSYIENGIGREITKEEALQILDLAEESGLVISPGNAQKTFCICCCCGCCCALLSNLKKLPNPAAFVASNHYAEVDSELCIGCGTCLDRCQIDAITVEEKAIINLDRCIGCGLCVTTCPEEALTLRKKDESQIIVPPSNVVELYMKIGNERLQKRS
ncbi:MAG: ATP-binding protein [Promethearchaeota archaeon]